MTAAVDFGAGRSAGAIWPFSSIGPAELAAVVPAIDHIFYSSSSVTTFADDAARDAFRWLWLGRYLAEEPEHAFVAFDGTGQAVGYLVGSLDDPAQRPEFASLSYFQDFSALTPEFPAHLHINVAAHVRSQGVGRQLVEAFGRHARAAGIGGMHVVTGAGMRNVAFYSQLGFVEVGRAKRGSGAVVMLGRKLS